jgi:hypothetical protein
MPSSSAISVLSRTNTMQAISNQIGSKVRTVAHYGLPSIEFNIEDSDGPRRVIPSYSTMDTIAGHVTITAAYDTRFEDIDISFIGKSEGICFKYSI